MRYTFTQGQDPRSTLVVDTCETIDDATISRFKHFLHEDGCANGLLFDRQRSVILRDTFTALSAESFEAKEGPSTDELLATLGIHDNGSLDHRVATWLRLLSDRWEWAIPKDSKPAAELLYDIVPATAGATMHMWASAA
jgi:hypothetical protein